MFKPLLDYLKQIANPTNGNSEAKLFLALVFSTYIIVAAFVDLLTKWKPTSEIFFGMIGIVLTLLGIDTYKQIRSIDVKGSVASDVVSKGDSGDASENAKQVLNSPKP